MQVFSMDCYFRGFGVSTSMVRVLITIVTPAIIMIGSVVFFSIYYAIKEGIKLFSNAESLAVTIQITTTSSFWGLFIPINYLKPWMLLFSETEERYCDHIIGDYFRFPSRDCYSIIFAVSMLRSRR